MGINATRAVVVKRGNVCAIRRDSYRCCLDITRVVETWDPARQVWSPEIRLCHLHALEYLTGKPVFMPTFAQQPVSIAEPLSSASAKALLVLFSRFTALSGSQFIYVERTHPKTFGGRKVAGILRRISQPIMLAEWQQVYGGGTYKLIVYGTATDGRLGALTEPVTIAFPGIPSHEGETYDE